MYSVQIISAPRFGRKAVSVLGAVSGSREGKLRGGDKETLIAQVLFYGANQWSYLLDDLP